MLGEQRTNQELYQDAINYLQNKPSAITDKQAPFAQDIYSSFQMLLNMDDWEKQYGGAPPANGLEMNPVIKNDSAPPPKKDSPKKH